MKILFIGIGALTRIGFEFGTIILAFMFLQPWIAWALLSWYVIWSILGLFVFSAWQKEIQERQRLDRVANIWGRKTFSDE